MTMRNIPIFNQQLVIIKVLKKPKTWTDWPNVMFKKIKSKPKTQVARKLAMVEADLERAEERAETGET